MSTLPKTIARLALAAAIAVILANIVAAHAESVDASELPTVIKVGRENALAFDASYKGYQFFATLPLGNVERAGDSYNAIFNAPGGYLVQCPLGDRFAAVEAMTWTSGKRIGVTGTIETAIVTTLELKNCKFETATAKRS